MNPIMKALSSGHKANDILRFLTNSYPQLSPKIAKAAALGYGADQILRLLTNSIDSSSNIQEGRREDQPASRTRDIKKEKAIVQQKKIASTGLKLGGLAATGLASRALMGLGSSAISPDEIIQTQPQEQTLGLPYDQKLLEGRNQPLGLQNLGPSPSQPMPTQPAPNNPIPSTPSIKASESLGKLNILDQIQNMIQAGNQPENISQVIPYIIPKESKNELNRMIKSGEIESLGKLIQDFSQEMRLEQQQPIQIPDQKESSPPIIQKEQPTPQENPFDIAPIIEQRPLEKGSRVITSDGDIGEIEALPGKTAKIKTDSGSKITESEDLTPVPENEKEILKLYEDLINAIPEHLRSSNLNLVEYDEGNNNLYVKFHNGSSYFYDEIPERDVIELKELMQPAKTSGENIYGAWAEGEGSRGAKMFTLIQRLRKERGTGKEFKGKFKNVYDYMELPKTLLNKKISDENERRKQEKARLKKTTEKPKKPKKPSP